MVSIFVFLFGLISEQIAAMRFENTQRLAHRMASAHRSTP